MRHRRAIIISGIGIIVLCILTRYAYHKRHDIKQFVHECKLKYNSSKKADMNYLKSLDLPVVLIQTDKEPSFEEVPSPTGWGQGIKNAEYVQMNIDILLHDSLLYSNYSKEGEIVNESKIKIRGNASAYNDKKSYKIKFSNKTDLLSRGGFLVIKAGFYYAPMIL